MSTVVNTTLRPGYLVACSTSIKGNVSYAKQDLGFLNTEDGATKTKWETERTIKDAAEQKAAAEVRSKARTLISGICSVTDFGYLCPIARKPDLDKAADEARKLCAEFNATSKYTYVRFNIGTGYVADNDENAIKTINAEVRELLDEMKVGIENLDVKRVREAADRATQIGQMLTPDAEVRIELAVKAVREQARKIVKAGETAAIEVDRATINRLVEARHAFLDVDGAGSVVTPEYEGRAIDLAPESAEFSTPEVAARVVEV